MQQAVQVERTAAYGVWAAATHGAARTAGTTATYGTAETATAVVVGMAGVEESGPARQTSKKTNGQDFVTGRQGLTVFHALGWPLHSLKEGQGIFAGKWRNAAAKSPMGITTNRHSDFPPEHWRC